MTIKRKPLKCQLSTDANEFCPEQVTDFPHTSGLFANFARKGLVQVAVVIIPFFLVLLISYKNLRKNVRYAVIFLFKLDAKDDSCVEVCSLCSDVTDKLYNSFTTQGCMLCQSYAEFEQRAGELAEKEEQQLLVANGLVYLPACWNLRHFQKLNEGKQHFLMRCV